VSVLPPLLRTGVWRSYRFAKGYSGNPGGSPEATRRLVNKAFLEALAEDFRQGGPEAIAKVRKYQPAAYSALRREAAPHRRHDVVYEWGGAVIPVIRGRNLFARGSRLMPTVPRKQTRSWAAELSAAGQRPRDGRALELGRRVKTSASLVLTTQEASAQCRQCNFECRNKNPAKKAECEQRCYKQC
jgi:hypothetical protein